MTERRREIYHFLPHDFLFSFLHELAHAGAARLFGCSFSIGTAGIFGNVMYVRSEGSTVFIKTFIQLAGPAANLGTGASALAKH